MMIVNCQSSQYNKNMKPPRANASVLATFLVLILITGVIYVFWQKNQPPLPAPGTVIDSTVSLPSSLGGEPEPTPTPEP